MISTSDPGFVLYVDHQGHPAPLSECFHATASRRLSSTVDRQHRPSTVTQVDSAFCPQCLSFHDASSASQLGYCPKPTCLQCPLCTSIVSCTKIDSQFCYTCGRCAWNSLQCNLHVESTSSSTEASTKEEVAAAVTKLAEMLKERREAGGHSKLAEDHYKRMISAWEGVVKPLPKASAGRDIQFKGRRQKDDVEAWSVESLEIATQKKKESFVAATRSVVGGLELQRISLDEEQTLDSALQGQPVESFALQALNGTQTVITSMADLLPLSIPLQPRKSRRCRAELAEGKPGILLKPKLNPLEGDSSLRTGHGQWWKKDSSAVHVMPRVRVVKYGSKMMDDKQQHAFLMKVTNPTLGMVRLQLGLSCYRGEPFWEDQPTKNRFLGNLLIDSLTSRHVDAILLRTTKTNDSLKSELVELDSAEDTIVDIGKVREVPDEVANWNAVTAMNASSASDENVSGLEEEQVAFLGTKVLAKKSGSAWFELVCATKPLNDPNLFPAIPITLRIEVGNGSWEASLIKATSNSEGSEQVDLVSFDLVITWPPK